MTHGLHIGIIKYSHRRWQYVQNNVSDIMKTELQKYDTLINDKGIALETQIEDKVYINCNAELIELVIDNYLSNAIKHSDENGVIRVGVMVKKG